MALLFRILKARPGRAEALLDCLRRCASRVGPDDEERCLLVCGTDDPGEFLWIGRRTGEARPAPRSADLIDSIAEPLLEPAPAVSLRFVGGWHRLPAPPYQIWNVEVRGPGDLGVEGVTELLTPPGGEGADHLVGRSVFRAIDDGSVFVGFVALTWSWIRRHPVSRRTEGGAPGAVAVWRPLSTVYRAEAYRGGVDGRPLSSLWTGVAPAPAPLSVGVSS